MHGIFAVLTIIAVTNLAPSASLPQLPTERPAINRAAESDAIKSDSVIHFDAPVRQPTTYLR